MRGRARTIIDLHQSLLATALKFIVVDLPQWKIVDFAIFDGKEPEHFEQLMEHCFAIPLVLPAVGCSRRVDRRVCL
jgi:hypothetical protein